MGFGSNAGNRFLNIRRAVRLVYLSDSFDILKLSRVYETEPWGFKSQNNYLNCAAVCLCRTKPLHLLEELKKFEFMLGRAKRIKWREREIDIDILFYGDEFIKERGLEIPHPFIQYRNFVLRPLDDLIPGYTHPVLNRTIRFLLQHTRDLSRVSIYKKQLV